MEKPTKVDNIDGLTVSASVLGNLLGVSDRRVRQLADEGIFVRASKGRYDLPSSIKTYINMIKMENEIRNNGDDEELDLEVEKALHERIKRKQGEIKLALMKGESHKSRDVERVMVDMLASFKARLFNIPSKMAPMLVMREDAGVIKSMLTKEVTEVLHELKEYNPVDFYGEDYVDLDQEDELVDWDG